MGSHFEEKLAEQELYTGPVLRLTQDTVRLEDGRQAGRIVVHHHGGAGVAALSQEGDIFLVKQFRYPVGEELWEIPAGKLEPGEDPLLTAKRELAEEAGLAADTYLDLGPLYPTVGYSSEIIYIYAAKGLHRVPMHLDEDEFLEPHRVPLAEAVAMVMDGRIRDSKTAIACLKLEKLRAQGAF